MFAASRSRRQPVTVPASSWLWLRRAWFVTGLVIILGLALAFRLPRLDVPNDNYDEGVYLESLLLMRDGYRPFTDIVATQGPLHLYAAYPAYALGGYTLAAARVGAIAASVLGVLGVALAGCTIAGPAAGLGAALILALSPTYLAVSRQMLPEPPAIGLAALAVGLAALAGRTGRGSWGILAGLVLGAACLIKPIVATAVFPVLALTVVARSPRQWLGAPIAAAVVCGLGLAVVGFDTALGQVVGWRVAGGQLDPTALPRNVALLVDKMWQAEHPATYLLALVGAGCLVARGLRPGIGVICWAVASLLLLLCYSELSGHLGATLMAPVAILAGTVFAAAAGALRWPLHWVRMVPLLIAVTWCAVALPSVVQRDRGIVAGTIGTDRDGPDDEWAAARTIAEVTAPGRFVVTDAPYLAFLANRRVPPALVDPSNARIRAGVVTAEQMRSGLDLYDADVVILWTGKLARLGSFMDVLDRQYESVAQFGTIDKGTPRAVYVRPADDDDESSGQFQGR